MSTTTPSHTYNQAKITNRSPWERDDNKARQTFVDGQKKLIEMLKQAGQFGGGNKGNNNKGDLPPFPPIGITPKLIGIILVVIGAIWLASGFYILQEDEESVVMRFGEFVRNGLPGPNYHLPYPIETMQKYPVTRVQREEIGFRSGSPTNTSYARRQGNQVVSEESLMLTGDENILDINFVVQWKIKNLQDFVFKISDPFQTVKYAAESAMREVIGQTPLTDAQTEKRAMVEESVKDLLQSILDSYSSGIEIVGLQMLKVDPPEEVVEAFRDVQTARADKERLINEAYSYRNDILPRARGQAAKIIQAAEAYRESTIAKAAGDVRRFEAVQQEYAKAKDVTKRRIYLDTLQEIMSGLDKIIIDNDVSKGTVPYLPLNQLGGK